MNVINHSLTMFSRSDYQIRIVVMLYGQTGRNRKWKIQDDGHYNGIAYISACRLDKNAISTAKPMFPGFSNATELLRLISTQLEVENLRWRPFNWKYLLYLNLETR